MIRGAIILLLATAAALTAVGWTLSYTMRTRANPIAYRLSLNGWSYQNLEPSQSSKLVRASGSHGSFSATVYVRSSLLMRLIPEELRFGNPYGGNCLLVQALGTSGHMMQVTFPFGCALLLFAAYPAYALVVRRIIPIRRRKTNRCVACGYDLTGNESGVCSECGNARESVESNK